MCFCSSVMELKPSDSSAHNVTEPKHNTHNYQNVMFLRKCYVGNSYQKLHIAAFLTSFIFCTVLFIFYHLRKVLLNASVYEMCYINTFHLPLHFGKLLSDEFLQLSDAKYTCAVTALPYAHNYYCITDEILKHGNENIFA